MTSTPPKWKHSYLNDPTWKKEPLKKKKTKKKAFQSCWFRLWNTNTLHVKVEQQAGAPKVSPPGAVVLCGQWETVDFSTTYSLLEPRFTSPVGHTISVCPSNKKAIHFSPGLIHKDGNIEEGSFIAKAFLYAAALLTFSLQGTLQERGSNRIRPMIEKAYRNDFSGTWAGEEGFFKPYAIHFVCSIFVD